VTSTTRDAQSANIADYNAFVTTAANSVPALAALGTTWKAIGSTQLTEARDNTGTHPVISVGVPIYLLDGTLIASSNADLWDGTLAAPIDITEAGTQATPSLVWTGTSLSGIRAVDIQFNGPGPPLQTAAWLGTHNMTAVGSTAPGTLVPIDPPGPALPFSPNPTEWTGSTFEIPMIDGIFLPYYATSDILTAVPEPSTIVLACLAAAALAVTALRRRSSNP
jgi:hypothetical protein